MMALSTSSIVASVSLLHLAAASSDLRKEHGCSIAKEANFARGKWKTRKAGTGTGTGTGTEIRKRSSDAHMYNIIPP